MSWGQAQFLEAVGYQAHVTCPSIVYHQIELFIPHHTIVAGYYGFELDVMCPSVCGMSVNPSVNILISRQ